MVYNFPNKITNIDKEFSNIIDLPNNNSKLLGNLYKDNELLIYINNTLVQTLNSTGITYHVDKTISEDVLYNGGDIIVRNGKIYFNDALNTSNFITYKSSNVLDVTAGSEIELNSPLISCQNNLHVDSKSTVATSITNMSSFAKFEVGGRVCIRGNTGDNSAVLQFIQHGDTVPHGYIFYGEDNNFKIRNDINGNKDMTFSQDGILAAPSITTPSLTSTSSLSLPNNTVTNAMINNLDVTKINFNSNINIGNNTLTVGGTVNNNPSSDNSFYNCLLNNSLKGYFGYNSNADAIYVNTNSSIPLIFFTNNVERFRIYGTGEAQFQGDVQFDEGITSTKRIKTDEYVEAKYFRDTPLVFSTVVNESRSIENYKHIVINASACKLSFRQIDINISEFGNFYLVNNHTATSTITIDISALTVDRDIKLFKNDEPVVEVDKTVSLIVDFTIKKESITQVFYEVKSDTVVLYVKN